MNDDTPQTGTPQTGTPRTSTPQTDAPRTGTPQTDAPQVVWIDPPAADDRVCVLCRNVAGNRLLLRARHIKPEYGYLDVVTCGGCASAWFPTAADANIEYNSAEQAAYDPNFQYLVDHYVELVNGLTWKVPLLERLPIDRIGSVLEVGCNVGVLLDYCRTMWDAEVVGLEPSAFGIWGGRLLDIPIHQSYMHEAADTGGPLHGRRFDLLVATEVIEHVPVPVGFLRDARTLLADDGIVLLTTPRAGALAPSTPPGELYAALSVGAHHFLMSPDQLEVVAREAGFGWCAIEPFGMTQVAVMGAGPIELSDRDACARRIARYHERRARQPAPTHPRLRISSLVNHYIASSELGGPVADGLWDEIRRAIDEHFALDLDDPSPQLGAIADAWNTFELGKIAPYNTPGLLYWRARHLAAGGESPGQHVAFARLLVARGFEIDYQHMWTLRPLHDRLTAHGAPTGDDELSRLLLTQAEAVERRVPELDEPARHGRPGSADGAVPTAESDAAGPRPSAARMPWLRGPARSSARLAVRLARSVRSRLSGRR